MALLRKNTVRPTGADGRVGVAPHSDFDGFQASWEFLSMTVWEEDGSARTPGTLLVMVDAAGLKVMLNDKDGSRVAFGVVGSEESILERVEAMLTSTATDWRASTPARGANRK